MADCKRVDRKLVAKGSIIDYYHDTMQFANGNVEVWATIAHKWPAPVLLEGEN